MALSRNLPLSCTKTTVRIGDKSQNSTLYNVLHPTNALHMQYPIHDNYGCLFNGPTAVAHYSSQ